MSIIVSSLPYIQIILSLILVTLVLIQNSDEDLGGAFGGSDGLNNVGHTRRGLERTVFNLTILVVVLFVASTLVALIIR